MQTSHVTLQHASDIIFSLDKVQLPVIGVTTMGSPSIAQVAVANNHLFCVLEHWIPSLISSSKRGAVKSSEPSTLLLKVNLSRPDSILEVPISPTSSSSTVDRLFCCPSGRHLLLTTTGGDCFYLHDRWRKMKTLPRLKGIPIRAVSFGVEEGTTQDPTSTGSILIGSADGRIYEVEILSGEDLFKRGVEKVVKQLAAFPFPIHFLHHEHRLVLMTLQNSLYQLNSEASNSSSLASFFQSSEMSPHQEISGIGSFHNTDIFLPVDGLSGVGNEKRFAWMTGSGIYHGLIQQGHITGASLLPYPTLNKGKTLVSSESTDFPIDIKITRFHFLLLYEDRLVAVCFLDGKLVFEHMFRLENGERVSRLVKDPSAYQTYWMYTNLNISEIVIQREEQNIWSLYLERGQFDLALSLTQDSSQQDLILTKEAEHYFSRQKYSHAAMSYSRSSASFSKVALSFLVARQYEALIEYMSLYLKRRNSPGDEDQILKWLMGLVIEKGKLSDDMKRFQSKSKEGHLLKDLISSYRKSIANPDILELFELLADETQMIGYLRGMNDYRKLVEFYLRESDWSEALKIVSQSATPELLYQYSSTLIRHIPDTLVATWMRYPGVDPVMLITAMCQAPESKPIIIYLRHEIEVCLNPNSELHNLLASLEIAETLNSSEGQKALIKNFLSLRTVFHYDISYAYSLCARAGLSQACIYLLGLQGLYEQSITLALDIGDIQLAKMNADQINDVVLKRKLWLEIARHTIALNDGHSKSAIPLLQECPLLKIEDILPFFGDFSIIRDFKKAICSTLDRYDEEVEEAKAEIREASKSAEYIEKDTKDLTKKFAMISSSERCWYCRDLVIGHGPFLLFPCAHCFHSSCVSYPEPCNASVSVAVTMSVYGGGDDDGNQLSLRQDCPACGDKGLVETIDLPFVGPGETM